MILDTNNNLTIGSPSASGNKRIRCDSATLADGESVQVMVAGGAAGTINRYTNLMTYKHAGITNPVGVLGLNSQDGSIGYIWVDDNDQPRMSTNANHAGTTSGSALAKDYEEATATLTATGLTTSPTGIATFVRVGKQVTMEIPNFSGTSNATTFTLTGIPTNMRPTASRTIFVRTQDNGSAVVVARGIINSAGVLALYKDVDGTAAFTASGTKSCVNVNVSYII